MEIQAVRGDITREQVDAIVNAANSSLLGGGGVDGAIHRAAGPGLLEECMELRRTELLDGLPVGDAVPTAGHALPAAWVIHTVGPNAHRGQTDPALLASCFTSSLRVAADVGASTVAFPAVGAGVYGWAVDDVARIAVEAVRTYAAAQDAQTEATQHPGPGADDRPGAAGAAVAAVGASAVRLVRFVLFDDRALHAFTRVIAAG